MEPLTLAMYATALLVCGLAFLRGGRAERLAAAIMAVIFVINFLPGWREALTGEGLAYYSAGTTLAIDIVQLAALLAVALTHRPGWTLFAAAFQLLATIISFIRATEQALSTTAYVTAQNTLWWLTMAALAYGVWQAATKKGAASAAPSPQELPQQS